MSKLEIQPYSSTLCCYSLNLKYLNLSYQIFIRFMFVYKNSLKIAFQTGFCVKNHLLNLHFSVVNSKRLFCIRIKAFILNFLYVYKEPEFGLKSKKS